MVGLPFTSAAPTEPGPGDAVGGWGLQVWPFQIESPFTCLRFIQLPVQSGVMGSSREPPSPQFQEGVPKAGWRMIAVS